MWKYEPNKGLNEKKYQEALKKECLCENKRSITMRNVKDKWKYDWHKYMLK